MPEAMRTILEHSNAGVAIFFVISGFVITHSLAGIELSLGAVGRFMLRRSLRLDPAYWTAIALACLILIVKGTPDFSALQIADHLLYAQDLFGVAPLSPIFWTLCLEVQFYLIFALILLSGSQALLLLAFALSLPLSCIPIWQGLFTELWYGFLLGVGTYCSLQKPGHGLFFVPFALCFLALGLFRGDLFMDVCAVTALLLLYAGVSGRISTWLNWRAVQFLGAISYSLYLFHNPVTGVTFRAGYAILGHSAVSEIVVWCASIALSICVAAVAWALIERPSLALSRMVPMRRLGPEVGVA